MFWETMEGSGWWYYARDFWFFGSPDEKLKGEKLVFFLGILIGILAGSHQFNVELVAPCFPLASLLPLAPL